MIAIANIYSANIVIFNENGPYYFATRYKNDHTRTLFLAYRISVSGKHNHYDSVCDVSNIVLSGCALDLCSKGFDESNVMIIND